ncbi:MAG TPA: hypothetical protein VLA19_05570 [Herpetosiphonaceae bacterium]|nr:hypothetical protein [Herpetosiphonaceae bacterium]
MPAQTRRPAGRPSRSQRRAGAQTARTYAVPPARTTPAVPRRVYAAEPPPVDHSVEFRYIRKDLIRILIWAGLILATMVALSFVF